MDTTKSTSTFWCEITDGPNREALFDALRLGKDFRVNLGLFGNIPKTRNVPEIGLFTRHDDHRVESISLVEGDDDEYEVRFHAVPITYPALLEFVARYNVRTRKGKVILYKFAEPGETTVNETARGAHLMLAIEMMVRRVVHADFDPLIGEIIKDEIAGLYEKAKLIHRATTPDQLSSAHKELLEEGAR